MANPTKYKANVYVTNKTGYIAHIEFGHQFEKHKESKGKRENLGLDQTMGPIEIAFSKGSSDWWAVVKIPDGEKEGLYKSDPERFGCELSGSDSGTRIDVEIALSSLTIKKLSGNVTAGMKRVGPYHEIKHIFVLMLENHSFDHIFGYSTLSGTDPVTRGATTVRSLAGTETNTHNGVTYTVRKTAVDPMTTDPGHEFLDALEQLCGAGVERKRNGPYPPINMSGFAFNYATSERENSGLPTAARIGDTMACCDPSQVAALHELAAKFAICDNWFSSLPGPTLPNRLFAMGASSKGMDDSPKNDRLLSWGSIDGLDLPSGSIFDAVDDKDLEYRIYQDFNNDFALEKATEGHGDYPMACVLSNVTALSAYDLSKFAKDLDNSYDAAYTFIEPHYGNAKGGTFIGGSSQHPRDSLLAGDKLVAATYKAIRNSKVWKNSLLIITYDEHGGFYDHVVPGDAPPPKGLKDKNLNQHGFDFSKYGVRVPAVVVSPYIPEKTIDHTLYDHTSIIKTTTEVFSLGKDLTERDANANTLEHLLDGEFRKDCPTFVTPAADPPPKPAARGVESLGDAPEHPDDEPLPEQGNIHVFIYLAAKVDFELSDRSEVTKAAIIARVQGIRTWGEAREYIREVSLKLKAYRKAQGR